LAYSIQEIDAVPAEDHDQPLDLIVTETGIVRPEV
jgi:5-formyltetrahydrofolate cyclo-ligase